MYDRIALASRPQGEPTEGNFRFEPLPAQQLGDGQIELRTIWLSLDPYMRGRMDDAKSYAAPVNIDDTMEGGGVAEVVASKSPHFQPGDIVMGMTGWASGGVYDTGGFTKVDPTIAPISTSLGVLGMPGWTAWVGLTRIAEAKEGETCVISAASGAVGSLAGQLAKARGLRVIGVAGGAEKCAYVRDDLGFDVCLDHRTDVRTLRRQIKEAAPDGVDVYFENVGGVTTEAVLPCMNTFGRIAVCGMIAWYNGQGLDDAAGMPLVWRMILTQRLRVQGFIVTDHIPDLPAFYKEVAPMVASGQIKYRESVTEGLENAPSAFLGLLNGANFGKQLIKVSEAP